MKDIKKYKSSQVNTIIYRHASVDDILASELGERYKGYREKWKQAAKCVLVQDFPLHLNFELFYGCNLKCAMCIYSLPINQRNYKVDPAAKVTFEKYCAIIDEGSKRGLYAVQLNGINEPLLQRDLIKHIEYAKQAGIIDIFIVTNATLLTPEISKGLIGSGLTQIKFSLDSLDEGTYEKMRVGGNFKKTMANIHRFIELKKTMKKILPVTRVSLVKTKNNMAQIDDFVEYWADKIDYIMIQDMINPFWGSEEYNKLEEISCPSASLFTECAMPYQRLYIRNNGEVAPCCSTYGFELPMGSIYENSIYEIWNNERMRKLRENVNGNPDAVPLPCKKCRQAITHQANKPQTFL